MASKRKKDEFSVEDELAELLNSPEPIKVVEFTEEPKHEWEIEFKGGKVWWEDGPNSDIPSLIQTIAGYLDGTQGLHFLNDPETSKRITINWLRLKGKI